jgi:hypothetical protein
MGFEETQYAARDLLRGIALSISRGWASCCRRTLGVPGYVQSPIDRGDHGTRLELLRRNRFFANGRSSDRRIEDAVIISRLGEVDDALA